MARLLYYRFMKKTARHVYMSRWRAITYLLLTLALAGFAGRAFVSSHLTRVPTNVQRFSGVVRDVRFSKNKYGNVTGIFFRVGTDSSELSYMDFYPSFERAEQCLVDGASVAVLVSVGTKPTLWQLECAAGRVAEAEEMLAARRANGRAAGWVMGGFLLLSLLWVWLLVSGRTY